MCENSHTHIQLKKYLSTQTVPINVYVFLVFFACFVSISLLNYFLRLA